jgi:hypothetical protein
MTTESEMTAAEIAQQEIEKFWGANCRFGMVTTHPLRPGRGRTAQASNRKGWRLEMRSQEVERFRQVVHETEQGLTSGALNPEQARQVITAAGYAEFVRVAASKEEMVQAFAQAMRDGNYNWIDYETPDAGAGRLVRLECYYERHPRPMA